MMKPVVFTNVKGPDIFELIRRRNQDDRYEWKPHAGFDFKGDAHEIGSHLEALAVERGGMISTEEIVADGEIPGSPLYLCFEHDMEVAAMNWSLHTARNLMNSLKLVKVKIEYNSQGEEKRSTFEVPAFPNVRVNGQRQYIPVYTVAAVPELKDQLVNRLLREAKNFAIKAKEFNIFASVVKEIEALPEEAPEPVEEIEQVD